MEAVIWLEDYLSRWDKILLLVSHSQDFLNNVCTHMVHFTGRKKLVYYDGNYDQFIKTKREKEENQCMPLVVKHLSRNEIHDLVGNIMGKRSSDLIAQIMTMAVQNLTRDEREEMIK